MGDIKRRRRLFSRPRKLFDRVRIDEEDSIVQKYGLKNKREIWKAKSAVSRFRKRAKALIGKSSEDQRKYFEKLDKIGLNVSSVADALALTERNLLDRRLQTVVFRKGLANSPRQARQLIVHKRVSVAGSMVNIPSFLVTRELEDKLSLKEMKVKSKPVKEAAA